MSLDDEGKREAFEAGQNGDTRRRKALHRTCVDIASDLIANVKQQYWKQADLAKQVRDELLRRRVAPEDVIADYADRLTREVVHRRTTTSLPFENGQIGFEFYTTDFLKSGSIARGDGTGVHYAKATHDDWMIRFLNQSKHVEGAIEEMKRTRALIETELMQHLKKHPRMETLEACKRLGLLDRKPQGGKKAK